MKTVFKKGMKVYDQLVFPDKEGKVISVVESDDFPIKVHYEGLEINELSYTADGRYYTDIKATLATKPYIFEGFEQKAPLPTFEEVIKEACSKGDYYRLAENLVVPNKELAEAVKALLKLLFLRDYYNEGWQPNKKDKEQRGVSVTLDCDNNFMVWGILKETEPYKFIFKNDETADKFLEEQKELLEIAKPLL